MEDDSFSLEDGIQKVIFYTIISVFSIFILLLLYGVAKDYMLFPIYELAVNMQTNGMVAEWVITSIVSVANVLDVIPLYLDWFWLLLSMVFFIEVVIASYYVGRKTWFSSLGFLTIGILFSMFITGLVVQIANWLQINLIDGLLTNTAVQMPFFTFYLSNVFIINILIIALCIVSNFIDFDFSGFNARKQREGLEEVN